VTETVERGADWVLLHGIEQRRLSEARLQAHYALQWLARTARAYVSPQPGDGHTNLGWDGGLGGFVTHPLQDGARLSLRLMDLTLAWHGAEIGSRPLVFPLDGCTDTRVRHWFGEHLASRGLDAQALDAPAPYEMPTHAIALSAPYGAAGLTDALAELAAWFNNAARSLGIIHDQMQRREWAASPVRCWPHHFDIATLITLPARATETTASIGAGLSPGDEYYEEPYFYVSVYPEPDPRMLPTLPMLGHWHERDFIAAVATTPRILNAKNQKVETDDFLRAAISAAITVLC
jgi:hypothetical protein